MWRGQKRWFCYGFIKNSKEILRETDPLACLLVETQTEIKQESKELEILRRCLG